MVIITICLLKKRLASSSHSFLSCQVDLVAYLPCHLNISWAPQTLYQRNSTTSMLFLRQYAGGSQLGLLLYYPPPKYMIIPSPISRSCLFLSFITTTLLLPLTIFYTDFGYILLTFFLASNFPQINVNYHYVIPTLKNFNVSAPIYGIKSDSQLRILATLQATFKSNLLLKTPGTEVLSIYS